jgi:hypothetical protein
MKYYAGIGSRRAPPEARELIHEFALELNRQKYTLRSGGADGADSFFEEVAILKEIFLPWKGFNKRPRVREHSDTTVYVQSPTQDAIELAHEIIDRYDEREDGPRMLLARNMHQVLGEDLATPVEFVICWTLDGKVVGGTAHAINLARRNKIPIYNLARSRDVESLRSALYQQELF